MKELIEKWTKIAREKLITNIMIEDIIRESFEAGQKNPFQKGSTKGKQERTSSVKDCKHTKKMISCFWCGETLCHLSTVLEQAKAEGFKEGTEKALVEHLGKIHGEKTLAKYNQKIKAETVKEVFTEIENMDIAIPEDITLKASHIMQIPEIIKASIKPLKARFKI